MLKVFNSHAISRNQRFAKAILWGIPTALIIGIVYGIISYILPFEFSIVHIGVGYLIGYVIKIKGRGVHLRFSILAAGVGCNIIFDVKYIFITCYLIFCFIGFSCVGSFLFYFYLPHQKNCFRSLFVCGADDGNRTHVVSLEG